MTYRETYLESRQRYLTTYDVEEVSRYDEWISAFSHEEHEACLNDIRPHFNFSAGMNVIDAGAGTGAFCLTLATVPKLQVTALEPCPAMLAKLVSKPDLRNVATKEGFCDHPDDQVHFAPESFDVIASRQLLNGLAVNTHETLHGCRCQGLISGSIFGLVASTGQLLRTIHSHAFPFMSCKPQAFACFVPTG